MRYKHIYLFVFFTLLLLFYPGDASYLHTFAYNRSLFSREPPVPKDLSVNPIPVTNGTAPAVTAEGVYIADLPSFTPIYTRNAKERLYPASTTKIITALVVRDIYHTDDVITVKRGGIEGQVMDLVPGERITAENLLYGILVHSANDAAYAFADNAGYDHFIDLMNQKAKELHMTGSHFANPAGLDDPGQYTTPYDLALAARKLLQDKYLSRFVATKEIEISDVDYVHFHRLVNVNKLLGEIHGIGGLKTGETEWAGENLVSFYKKNGHEYLVVILKSEDRFADTTTVVNWLDSSVSYFELDPSIIHRSVIAGT